VGLSISLMTGDLMAFENSAELFEYSLHLLVETAFGSTHNLKFVILKN